MNLNAQKCIEDAQFVKQSLLDAWFLINEEKSVFSLVKMLELLGIIWNSSDFTLRIPKRRVDYLFISLNSIFEISPRMSECTLAQITGRIISMSPVIGNISRIMTRYCYMSIENRSTWDAPLILSNETR